MTKMKDISTKMMALLLGLSLSACGMLQDDGKPTPCTDIDWVTISLDSDANNDSATAVDLVIVHSQKLMETLMKLSAHDYYKAIDQLRRDYPEMFDVWHWELTPGQLIRKYPINPSEMHPIGAIVYARYNSHGIHRVRLASTSHPHIRLKRLDFCVLEQGCFDTQDRSVLGLSDTAKQDRMSAKAISGSIKPAANRNKDGGSSNKELKKFAQETQGLAKKLMS